jgi:Tfp pilus assembly protein PilF
MRRLHPLRVLLLLFGLTPLPVPTEAQTNSPDQALVAIQHQWAHITYQLPKSQRDQAYDALETETDALIRQAPQRVEPKVWQAIILSTHADVHGGLGALSMAKRARNLLLQAWQIDPDAMHGSIYTTLGSLYYQVPGWPLGFGDKSKARAMLQKALQVNPGGIDPNYFYGDFLYRNGDKTAALAALHKALAAPPRTDQPVADQGRCQQVEALIRTITASH